MTITQVTKNLSFNALRRLTARAYHPKGTTIPVQQQAHDPAYLHDNPYTNGCAFHRALANFLKKKGELNSEARMFYPFFEAIQKYLGDEVFVDFKPEVDVGNRAVHGRIDIVADGPCGDAFIEVKVVGKIPCNPKPSHIVQAALPGFLSGTRPQRTILVYVDLIGNVIRIFSWDDHNRACFKPWELKTA